MKELDLRKPEDCRWYCHNFEVPGQGKVGFVVLEGGRRVEFHNMSDDDAVTIANQLYQMELDGTARAKKRVIDEGGYVQ
jgi:hypothetical protein